MKKSASKSTLASPILTSLTNSSGSKVLEIPSLIKISCFMGLGDYIDGADWIELFDLITTDYNWTQLNKVIRVGGYLKGHALAWYVEMMKSCNYRQLSWVQFKEKFSKRFSSTLFDNTSQSKSGASSLSSQSGS